MSSSILATALAFARHGHAVFPVNWPIERRGRLTCSCDGEARGKLCGRNAAKHPFGLLAPNGLLSASTDSETITHWFRQAAPCANLGVRTDRLVVVDVDPRHDGDASFRELEREHGPMSPTWRAHTGGGGEHIMFTAPEGVEVANVQAEMMHDPPLGRGIDVRARGGYIIAPPSRHISGELYVWKDDGHPAKVQLAPAPSWLIERLVGKPSSTPSIDSEAPPSSAAHDSRYWAFADGVVTEYRDSACARLCGHLLRRWVDAYLALTLVKDWNARHCRPPLSDQEVTKIVHRIAARETRRLEREEPL